MKKAGKVLCLALGAALTLGTVGLAVGCGNSSSGGEIKIKVWVPEKDTEFAKQVAKDFQAANKDKTYKFFWGAQEESDAGNTLLKDVTNAPDVFSFASDQINPLIQGSALARIGGDAEAAVKAENTADAVDSATVTITKQNGETEEALYAFPYTDNSFFLYYNKEYFKNESDLASIDKILEVCANASAEKDVKKFGFPIATPWYLSSFYFGAGLGYTVKYDSSYGETEVTCDFGNETGLAVTEAIYGYTQNPNFVNSDDTILAAGFQDGSIIAGVSGIWNKNTFENYVGKDNLGAIKLPTYKLGTEDKQLVAFAGYKLMGVCKYSKVTAEAMKFAQFYTNRENQLKHYDARGFVPTNKEAQKDPRLADDQFAKAMSDQLQYSKTQKNVPTSYWTPIEGLGKAMLVPGFDPAKNLADAVKAIVKEAKN